MRLSKTENDLRIGSKLFEISCPGCKRPIMVVDGSAYVSVWLGVGGVGREIAGDACLVREESERWGDAASLLLSQGPLRFDLLTVALIYLVCQLREPLIKSGLAEGSPPHVLNFFFAWTSGAYSRLTICASAACFAIYPPKVVFRGEKPTQVTGFSAINVRIWPLYTPIVGI
jgi:hypothetical protein